jgi:outer membrane protein OmpA-like peptidoglycan-associated protein
MANSSSKWDVAIKRNLSGGEWITGGIIQFKLRNVETGTTNNMWFCGLGGGGSLLPVSYSGTMNPGYKRVRSAKPTTFEEIDGKSAIMRSAAATGSTGALGPSISGVWLKIATGLNPYGVTLMEFYILSAQISPDMFNPSISTPNLSVDRHWGKVIIQTLEEDLPDIPDAPIRPDYGPVIPFEPISPVAPPTRPKRVVLEADVLFGFDSAAIKMDAEHVLHNLVHEIECRTVPKVEIEGHADSTGAASYNLDLSRRRAEAVKEWFVKAGAPNALRYTVSAKGESQPIADNRTKEGRAKNRRVEVVIG